MPSFNEELAEWRKRNKLTQRAAAKVFSVTTQSISNWETGNRNPDDIDEVRRVMDAYDRTGGRRRPPTTTTRLADGRELRIEPDADGGALIYLDDVRVLEVHPLE